MGIKSFFEKRRIKKENYAAYEKRMIEEEEKKKIQDSDEPYLSILSDTMDKDGNVTMVMDWNQAFIKRLRDAGFRGITDDQVIDAYLYRLYTVKMEENYINDSKPGNSDGN